MITCLCEITCVCAVAATVKWQLNLGTWHGLCHRLQCQYLFYNLVVLLSLIQQIRVRPSTCHSVSQCTCVYTVWCMCVMVYRVEKKAIISVDPHIIEGFEMNHWLILVGLVFAAGL